MIRHFRAMVCAAVGGAFIGIFPAHAIELTPGTWQETETGTENGKPVPATTDTSCMTPEEAKASRRTCAAALNSTPFTTNRHHGTPLIKNRRCSEVP